MGLYPPSLTPGDKIPTSLQESQSLGAADPPFNVRDSTKVNTELGDYPLPFALTAIPIFNFEKNHIGETRGEGCPIVNKKFNEGRSDPTRYTEFKAIYKQNRDSIGKALDLPQHVIDEASFVDLYRYSDFITCK